MPAKLKSLKIEGFKTFKSLTFEPRSLNVLIGSNGSGKSNFLSFLQFLSKMLDPAEGLRMHVARRGRADAFLHDGHRTTPELRCTVIAGADSGLDCEYSFSLKWVDGDALVFDDERYRFLPGLQMEADASPADEVGTDWAVVGGGHLEPELATSDAAGGLMWPVKTFFRNLVVYHLQDTSRDSPMHLKYHRDSGTRLVSNGSNLAPFLLRLRDSGDPREGHAFQSIQETISLAFPQFGEFFLEPEFDHLLLKWREKGSDQVFSVAQASDGLLRFMTLTALLRQPDHLLPDVLLLDEPELGLHPDALSLVAGMIRSVSRVRQVIVATQSPTLVCEFEPADIVVVERKERESQLVRLNEEELSYWLKEYSLGDLWQKGWFGGGPFA